MYWSYGCSYGARAEIQSARSKASNAENKARAAEIDLTRLEARLDTLTLTCQAMWEVIRDQAGLTDEGILARMEEIDLRDGQKDGRLRQAPVDCPNCGRTANSRRKMCMYCGQAIESEHVFDK